MKASFVINMPESCEKCKFYFESIVGSGCIISDIWFNHNDDLTKIHRECKLIKEKLEENKD